MVAGRGKDDSVYDFLYVDHDRTGLLLSQFGTDGVLTEIVRQSESSTSSERGVDFKIVKLGTADEANTTLNKRFNARWLIPLLFLDTVQSRIRTDIAEASLGSLVMAAGTLGLLHTAMLQQLYQTSALQNIAIRKARQAHKAASKEFDLETAKLEIDAIARLDPQIQMHLFRADAPRCWSTLRPDGLVTPAAELSLKHGNIVAGDWRVLGILDAHRGDATGTEETDQMLAARFGGQVFLQEAIAVTGGLRRTYGRPDDAFGLTTLMIFRELSDADEGSPA